MRISDWSSDVCSSDLRERVLKVEIGTLGLRRLTNILRNADEWKDAPATLKAFAIGKALEHGGHGQTASDPKGLADTDPHEMTQEELVLPLAHLTRELVARMVDVSPDTPPGNDPTGGLAERTD